MPLCLKFEVGIYGEVGEVAGPGPVGDAAAYAYEFVLIRGSYDEVCVLSIF